MYEAKALHAATRPLVLGNWCHRFAGVYCLKETLPNTAATAMSGEMGDELQRERDKSSLHFFQQFC